MAPARPKVNFTPEAWVKIGDLIEHPKNPRIDLRADKARFKSLKESILEGVFEPIKVSKTTGYCLAGNQRLKAFQELGYTEVPVMYNECADEKEEVRIIIKDNNEWGAYDFNELASLIEALDLPSDGLGFSKAELEELELFAAGEGEFGEEFRLPSGDKAPFQQMTFILAAEQAKALKVALDSIKRQDEFNFMETYGNENSNGNALFLMLTQWDTQRK